MFSFPVFTSFILTTLLLNITPGPDMIYVSTRSIQYGIRCGIISALGIAVGYCVHISAAVLGLSVILAKSALAFDIVKYAGAAYLFYLGMKSILSKKTDNFTSLNEVEKSSMTEIFIQGVITSIFNPKVAIFFLSFLPQFIDENSVNATLQILILGICFIISATFVNILVATFTGKTGALLKREKIRAVQERVTGLVFIFLGLRLALQKQK